jgi:hypothetical protein
VQPFVEHLKRARDRLVRVRDAAGVRAPDHAFENLRDLHALLLHDLVVPNDVDLRLRRKQGDPVDLFRAEFPVLYLDDILLPHPFALDVRGDAQAFRGRPGDTEDPQNVQRLAGRDMVDDGAVPDRADDQPSRWVFPGHFITSWRSAILMGTPFFACSK